MAFITITHWTGTEMSDAMIDTARTEFVPMIRDAGADRVEMVRTGELTMTVVTHYASAEVAKSATDRITAIRAKATADMPMTMDSAHGGEVFANG